MSGMDAIALLASKTIATLYSAALRNKRRRGPPPTPPFLKVSQSEIKDQKFTRPVIPPSTTTFAPVVNEDAGEDRNTAVLAISCGVPIRPSGLRDIAIL